MYNRNKSAQYNSVRHHGYTMFIEFTRYNILPTINKCFTLTCKYMQVGKTPPILVIVGFFHF